MVMLLQLKLTVQLLLWLLLVVFVKLYRDSFFKSNDGFDLNMAALMAISIGFLLAANYPYALIYLGYLLPTRPTKRKTLLAASYYGISGGTLLYLGTIQTDVIQLGIVALLLFSSYPISAAMMHSYRQRFSLAEDNKHLRLLIKQNERDRIAQQLHDNLGQVFSLLAIKAELASKLIDKDPHLAKQQLADIAASSRQNLNLVRSIVADLKTDTIIATLNQQEKNLKLAHIMLVTKKLDIVLEWDKAIQAVLAQIIVEAVTNCIKYSAASQLTITFLQDDTNYQVIIADDGRGFDNQPAQRQTFGLTGIKEKIADLGGTVTFSSHNGAIIDITVPRPTNGRKND